MRRDIDHDITAIIVSPKDIIEALKRNRERLDNGRYVLRINPPLKGVAEADLHFDEAGARYGDGSTPLHIRPGSFLSGDRLDPNDRPFATQYPDRGEQRAECRDHHDLDDEEELPDDLWDGWWGEVAQMWREEVAHHIVDEMEIGGEAVRVRRIDDETVASPSDVEAACDALADPSDGRSNGVGALAKRLGVSRDAIRRWKNGERLCDGPAAKMINELVERDCELRDRIDEAVADDMDWLLGEAQELESWAGTMPDDVGPFEMTEGATSERIPWSDLDAAYHDTLREYARQRWKREREERRD